MAASGNWRVLDDDPIFSKCPETVLVEVLRRTSEHPQRGNWPAYLDPAILLRLCESEGELAAVACRSVPALKVPTLGYYFDGRECKQYEDDIPVNHLDRQALRLPVTNAEELDISNRLLKHLGPHLRKLTLNYSHFWTEDANIAGRFNNLKSLVLYDKFTHFDLPTLLSASSGKLRSLDLGGDFLPPRYIGAIAACCNGMEKLGLKFGEIGAPMLPVWECVGPTMREFVFACPARVEQDDYPECTYLNYDDIRDTCEVLNTLEIQNIGFGTMPVWAITSFRYQLETLRMTSSKSCLGPEELETIFDSCRPDITVHAFVESNRVATLNVLSNRAHILKLKYDTFDENLDTAFVDCTEVREVEAEVLSDYIEYFLRSVFVSPKPQLRKMNISVDGYLRLDPENNMFDQIADSVDTIEHLSCSVDSIVENIFSKFAEKNENIECVRIICTRSSSTHGASSLGEEADHMLAEDAAFSFLTDFLKCQELKELVLDDGILNKKSEALQAVVQSYTMYGKSIDVYIGKTQYSSVYI